MPNTELQRDCATLKAVGAGMDRLLAEADAARERLGTRERGYFLPDEDDFAKQTFLAYRNYRIALYDIIHRHQGRAAEGDYPDATSFVLAFGAAVILHNWSSFLIERFKDFPAVRAKLNEADARYGIEAKLFDQIYRILTRVETQERLQQAAHYFQQNLDAFRSDFPDGDFAWLIAEIERQYGQVKRSWREMWTRRLQRDLDVVPRAAIPLLDAAYGIKSWVLDLFGNIWLDDRPDIPAIHLAKFEEILQPGDFFIVRPERKSSTVFLPGWWTHGTLYFGGAAALRECGAAAKPSIERAMPQIETPVGGRPVRILEALAAGVILNPMEASMHVDHAVAFRPRLTPAAKLQALDDAFGHLGKPYDFEFDFRRSDRLVCTEVLYRAFHGKEAIRFTPRVRFGKPTVSADDIVAQIVDGIVAGNAPFDFLAMSTKNVRTGKSRFLTGEKGVHRLRATVRGV